MLSALLKVVARYPARYARGALFVVVANLLMVANPLIFRQALERGGSVWGWAFLLLVVATLAAVFGFLTRVTFITLSRDAERDLREEVFAKMQRQDAPFFDRHHVGDLMSRLVNDMAVYREVLGPGIMYPFDFVTMVVPALIALFWLSPWMAFVACIPIVLLPPMMVAIRSLLYDSSLGVQRVLGKLSALARENFSGIRLIKSYVQENAFAQRFGSLCRQYFRLNLRLSAAQNLFFPCLAVVGRLVTVFLIVLSGWLLRDTANLLTFMWIQGYLLFPILRLGWILPLYQRGRGAYERIQEVYNEEPAVQDTGLEKHGIGPAPEIELRDLSFTYENGNVLNGVTAQLPAGKIVGITGPPGSGKSTLFRLLSRDYPYPEGMVHMGGLPIEAYPLDYFRQQVALVEQEPYLFSKTLGENITFARPDAPISQVTEVMKAAQLADIPYSLDTLVGERGVTLSGGQKQRVAIARALLTDAPVLLLDDIFSALDAVTTEKLFTYLESLRGQKTILLITHRVSILQRTDYLLYFSRGKLVEQGKPSELSGGPFEALVELDQMVRQMEAG